MANNLIEQQVELTSQSNKRDDLVTGIGLLFWMAQSGQIVPPWWSKSRDAVLRSFWKDSDHMSGAFWMISSKLCSVPFRVEPRDMTMKSHIKQADFYNSVLAEGIEFGAGWEPFWTKFFLDLWASDNGAFAEVIGDGDPTGPIEGPAIGLAHLDSYLCQRTSNPEYPVIYQDTDGKRYRYHYSRVIYTSQMPSPAAQMNGVGHCWLTRAVNTAQNLIDISTYKQEKLGSRPPRGFVIGRGTTVDSVMGALKQADESMDNQGLSRFQKLVVMASPNPDFDLSIVDLASLPDGFDERTSTELGMFTISLAGGFPPRWLWPATTTGATKADAMYQHIAGSGGGASWHLNTMRRLLAGSEEGKRHLFGKFLPPQLKLVFDYQDDEQDRMQADVASTRAKTRETDLNDGAIDLRVAHERMLGAGDLTESQFDYLELQEGRLPNGDDVLTLFASREPYFLQRLWLGVAEPLAIDANDPTEMMLAIESSALDAQEDLAMASSSKERQNAHWALSALGKLKEIYSNLVSQDIQAEVAMEQQAAGVEPEIEPVEGEEAPEEEAPPEEEQPTEEEIKQAVYALSQVISLNKEKDLSLHELDDLVKQFNFGAKVGEIIRGALARGAGGQFVNAQQLGQVKNELLQRLIDRLRAKRASGGGKGGKRAEGKTDRERREGTFNELEGADRRTLDSLQSLDEGGGLSGEDQRKLVELGLASASDDGGIQISRLGQTLLGAANAGNIDRAQSVLDSATGREEDEDEDEEKSVKKKAMRTKDIDAFRAGVRAAIRGLWSGQTQLFDFVDAMRATIEIRMREAWVKGAAECGISGDELSSAELSALNTLTFSQIPHLVPFGRDIMENNRASGALLGPLLDRGELWIGRYNEAFNQGKAMACQDKKLKWVLGKAEHCRSCLKLEGKVKRASYWTEQGIFPRVAGASYLECHGFNCQCDLVPTDERASPGPLPRLP